MSKSELIFGLHAVQATLSQQPERVIELYALKGRQDQRLSQLLNEAQRQGISLQFMTRKVLDQKAGEHNRHQGIIARVTPAKALTETDLAELIEQKQASSQQPFLLILDGVTDPHNLGACLRSADAAGVDAIIAPKDNAAKMNGTVEKVACGAAQTVPFITVTNLARTMRYIQQQGIWIIGAAGETVQTIYQPDFTGAIALAMGAEGKGLRRLTKEHCDQLVKIPMMGSVSSLNVSVATGICLYEVIRQRQL